MEFLNHIFNLDAQNMAEVPSNSIKLMVTSPPYNVTKDYDENLSLKEYLNLLKNVLKEVYRVLKEDGICALNIANVGRKPYIPLDCYVIRILLDLGFSIYQEIIWDKNASAGTSCAWGSWKSSSNPSLRDVHEYIIIAYKTSAIDTDNSINRIKQTFSLPILNEISNICMELELKTIKFDEYDLYKNIWSFGAESAKKVNHPAPFRVELPYRLIILFTKENDIILDPFMGSGSTAIAALATKRKFIGYEINSNYIKTANTRINVFNSRMKNKN